MKRLIILILLSLVSSLHGMAHPPEDGKKIFVARCAACHNVNKVLVGPALAGVEERHSIEWIIQFVRSSQTVIKAGDKEANTLFAKFNNIPMPDHPDLSGENIRQIVEYIRAETKQASTLEKPPFPRPSRLRPAYLPVPLSDYTFFISYGALVILLILALLLFVRVKGYERNRNWE